MGTNGQNGGKFRDAASLAVRIAALWPPGNAYRLVVCTGGEPLLQLDLSLIDALHQQGFMIAIETNGTLPVPPGIDWVCVSPKADAKLIVTQDNELKVVVPQPNQPLADYEKLAFEHFLYSRLTTHHITLILSSPLTGANAIHAGDYRSKPINIYRFHK